MICLFPKCEAAGKCQGHVLSAPTPKGELLGVMMGAGFATTLITSYSLGWFNVESNGRTATSIAGIDQDG